MAWPISIFYMIFMSSGYSSWGTHAAQLDSPTLLLPCLATYHHKGCQKNLSRETHEETDLLCPAHPTDNEAHALSCPATCALTCSALLSPAHIFRLHSPMRLMLSCCMCRLPPSVQTPAERSGLTPSEYSLWLDSHSQKEAVRGLQVGLRSVFKRFVYRPASHFVLISFAGQAGTHSLHAPECAVI